MRHAVIVTAAGSSVRFNERSDKSQKKEFIKQNGHSVLYNAVKPFTEIDGLCTVLITYQKDSLKETEEALEDLRDKFNVVFVEGGDTRQKSVFNALSVLMDKQNELKTDYVSIHDGARPYVTKDLIERTLESAVQNGASAPAVPVCDTLIKKDSEGFICSRLDRTGVCGIQTPQVFKFPDIYDAHKFAVNTEKTYTDDTEIFGDFGRKVAVVDGDPKNIKITYRKDLC